MGQIRVLFVTVGDFFQEGEKPVAIWKKLRYNEPEQKEMEKFFDVVDSCAGKVELVTGEGDRLNLKSKLSQYVSLANIFSNGEIPELEIVAYEKEDIDKLMHFMING